tara:strand:- start:45 stop:437 length:393 start_codon:yes stop_codon:yes gene_type:complete
MPKWEYAAIVNAGSKWRLVKPSKPYKNNDVLSFESKKDPGATMFTDQGLPRFYWQYNERMEQKLNHDQKFRRKEWSLKQKSRNIIMSHPDLLCLMNMAGDKGWEITGGIGLNDGKPGRHETKWRMMRREM